MAAGLGFKTFTTGEVLTAADTNGYLMQGILVFASSAARASAVTSPQEGQYSYLKDTNALEYYDGAAWVGAPVGDITAVTAGKGLSGGGSSGDVTVSLGTTAKGDLVAGTGTTTAAALTVGTNGQVLTADSTAATGLAWATASSSPTSYGYAAGKNAIINGAFNVNQRAFTSTTTNAAYGFDRFSLAATDGTTTYTAQTFTAGAAPVSGYEAQNYARLVTTGQTLSSALSMLLQHIEDVRTFANQTVTVSFWAQAGTGTPKIAVELKQNFGTGGSPSADVNTYAGQVTLSTSWARYSVTVAVPSISGKTIGTAANSSYLRLGLFVSAGSTFDSRTGSLGIQSNTFNIWGVQVEAGSTATAFQTATGTIQGELAACQRYYTRINAGSVYTFFCNGNAYNTTVATCILPLPVTLRVSATSIDTSGTASHYRLINGSTATACSVVPALDQAATQSVALNFTVASGLTTGQAINAGANNTASAYIGVNAEL